MMAGDQCLATWSGFVCALPTLSIAQRRGLVTSSTIQFIWSLLKIASIFGECCLNPELKKKAHVVQCHVTRMRSMGSDKSKIKGYLVRRQYLLRLVGEIWRECIDANGSKLLAKMPSYFHRQPAAPKKQAPRKQKKTKREENAVKLVENEPICCMTSENASIVPIPEVTDVLDDIFD